MKSYIESSNKVSDIIIIPAKIFWEGIKCRRKIGRGELLGWPDEFPAISTEKDFTWGVFN